jgi:hypothetical protein
LASVQPLAMVFSVSALIQAFMRDNSAAWLTVTSFGSARPKSSGPAARRRAPMRCADLPLAYALVMPSGRPHHLGSCPECA